MNLTETLKRNSDIKANATFSRWKNPSLLCNREASRYNYFYEHSDIYANSKQFLRCHKSLRIIIRAAGSASDVCIFTISFNLF